MSNSSSSSSGGIGFWGLLTVALIVLKLLGYISLGWGWIATIFFVPLIIVVLIIVGAVAIGVFSRKGY